MFSEFGICTEVAEFCEKTLNGLKERFEKIDRVAEYNQYKVLEAMRKNRVSAQHFAATTGYGYDDMGRDTLEKVYADTFHTPGRLSDRRSPAERTRLRWLWEQICCPGTNFFPFRADLTTHLKKLSDFVRRRVRLPNTAWLTRK